VEEKLLKGKSVKERRMGKEGTIAESGKGKKACGTKHDE
jgi:hypothetical protein